MGRICEYLLCSKQASYGVEGSRRRQFCAQHAEDGMIDVCSKRCIFEGCSKHPTFGVAGSRKREFCSKHAGQGMMDLKLMKRCEYIGCSKHPSYGVEGGKREFCAEHAEEGMVATGKRSARGSSSATPAYGGKKQRFPDDLLDIR